MPTQVPDIIQVLTVMNQRRKVMAQLMARGDMEVMVGIIHWLCHAIGRLLEYMVNVDALPQIGRRITGRLGMVLIVN